LRAWDILARDTAGQATRREINFMFALQDKVARESGFGTVGYHCAFSGDWDYLANIYARRAQAGER